MGLKGRKTSRFKSSYRRMVELPSSDLNIGVDTPMISMALTSTLPSDCGDT